MNLPKVYSEAKVSPVGQVNHADLVSWLKGSVRYLIPLVATIGIMYLSPIMAVLQTPGHVFVLDDFVPSQMVVGAIVLYLVSQLYGLLTKFADGKK